MASLFRHFSTLYFTCTYGRSRSSAIANLERLVPNSEVDNDFIIYVLLDAVQTEELSCF